VNVTNSTLTVTVSGTANVNVTNSSITVTGNVNITNTSLNVNVTNSSLTVTVSGTVNVNVTNSSLTVTISGTPTINVQTSGGANIVIDKLTQGAYIERRGTLENNGTTVYWLSANYTYYRGKFFPRGCRGIIKSIEVYTQNQSASSDALSVFLSPAPGFGFIYSKPNIISVPAGAGGAWRSGTINFPWNYDSLFVAVRASSDATILIGYDTDANYDSYNSTDSYSWTDADRRLWIRVVMTGMTVGDLPVSGTLNSIVVPNTIGDLKEYSSVGVNGGSSVDIISVSRGAGSVTALVIHIKQSAGTVPPGNVQFTWAIDDKSFSDTLDYYLKPFAGVANTATAINMPKIDTVNNDYVFAINVPIPFKTRFKLTISNTAASGNKIDIDRMYILESLT
jgi:hypothetical protein